MNATILRSEVLKQMDSGEPFTMEFIKADRKRGTGGELVEVRNWVKKTNGINEARPLQKRSAGKLVGYSGRIKVVNIHNPFNKIAHPMGVHLLLMQTFNGKRIING
jgi:hypothetical protein